MNLLYEQTVIELERLLFEVENRFAYNTRHLDFEEPILQYIKVARLRGSDVLPIIDNLMIYINAIHYFGTLESLFVGICLLNKVKPGFYLMYLTGRNEDQMKDAKNEAIHFMKYLDICKY